MVVTIDETIPGAALDKGLGANKSKRPLELIAAHLSRVHSVPHRSEEEKPRH
jgi:hypothetical protein